MPSGRPMPVFGEIMEFHQATRKAGPTRMNVLTHGFAREHSLSQKFVHSQVCSGYPKKVRGSKTVDAHRCPGASQVGGGPEEKG